MSMVWIWISIFIAAVVVEIITTSALLSIWVALGALVAMVFALLKVATWLQIVVFIISTVVFMLIIRPLAKKQLRGNVVCTNADRVLNQIGIVSQTITPTSWGEVKIHTMTWHAISKDQSRIEQGERVRVKAIEGAKVIVERV